MKITITNDLKAGTYASSDAQITITAGTGTDAELTLDFQPAVVTPPAPAPAPAPAPVGNGTHAVTITTTIGGVAWTAQATVGEDPQAAGKYVKFTDAAGNIHPGMRAYFYADCCDVGAVNGRDGSDYPGSLTITYDGATVYDAHLVTFYRGTLNQTIRYGVYQPTWKPVDASLFPNYATPATPLPLQNLSRYDWSYNGMGCSSYTGMATTGMRGDIAYIPQWDVPMIVQPSDAAYAVVRKIADQSGVWPIYYVDDDTAAPFDITTYPDTSFLSPLAAKFAGNPIVPYGVTPSWKTTGSPLAWDEAHETGYNFVAAAATLSARDRFHAGVWANAVLTAFNPGYRQKTGIWGGYQERGSSWAVRSLFLASYLSDRPDYFAARLDEQRVHGETQITNPLGFQATTLATSFQDGSKGNAPWEENYTRLVVAVVAKKLPAWNVINDRLKVWLTNVFAQPWWQLSTVYSAAIHDAAGNPYATMADVIRHSLCGVNTSAPSSSSWPAADVDALLVPTITIAEVSALIRKNHPTWPGKDGDFSASYPTSCQDYGAIQTAAVASQCGAGPEWDKCQSIPTKPDWSQGWQWHVVP